MDKIIILGKQKIRDNRVDYIVEFKGKVSTFNFYRKEGEGWYIDGQGFIFFREEILLIENILRGLNS